MTVKELREILFELPDDLNVYSEDAKICSVSVHENYSYGDGKAKVNSKYVELS